MKKGTNGENFISLCETCAEICTFKEKAVFRTGEICENKNLFISPTVDARETSKVSFKRYF